MKTRNNAIILGLVGAALVCGLLFGWFWRYNAFPAEKQIARNIQSVSFGADLKNSAGDYCIPAMGLPVCSLELLENQAPGTPCFMQKCGWGHVTNLSLYGGQLEALPVEIAGLPGLVELNLHGNHLAALPPAIGQLSQLTELDLSGNQLTQLPAEIGQLRRLKKLDLSGNQLTSLPPEIGRLRSLTYLNLADNPLSGPLPGFITNLPLDTLVFSKTGLCVPADAGFQQWLSGVSSINFNHAPHPAELCSLAAEDQPAMLALYAVPGRPADWDPARLPCTWSRVGCDAAGHITRLDLSAVPLHQIPAEIGQLNHLQYLNLTSSQISEIPPEIGNLPGLTHLYLGENRLARLPREIGQLEALSTLDLHGNRLANLPQEMGQLTRLTFFDVSDNPLAGSLPAFLTHLPQVEFVFANTGLCIPQDPEMLAWLGKQAKGVYRFSESGELVFAPADPAAHVQSSLQQHGCR